MDPENDDFDNKYGFLGTGAIAKAKGTSLPDEFIENLI